MSFVLALDQGTTSSRAIAVDHSGKVLASAQREFPQHYPRPGWVEHDPQDLWESQLAVARESLAGVPQNAGEPAALGITNQRETTLLWDRRTGEPVHPAIVWQDRRTSDRCEALTRAGHSRRIRERTGLVIDPYFCGTKLQWLLDEVPGVRRRAERGELAFGTVDTWLIWKLTSGRVHATDRTNASRTMLYDIVRGCWDEELLEILGIPDSLLPDVFPSGHRFGETDPQWFGRALPIAAAAGDQQSALYGQNCTRHGMAKNTYGTGCFALMHIGDRPLESRAQLLTTLACGLPDAAPEYALEGSVFIAGAAVQWLRDGLGIIDSSAEVEALAASVPDSDDVYLVPAFAGLGAPHWDAHARGTLVGITRGTHRGHIARAALEGIAFQVADVLETMRDESGVAIDELRVDGGAAANDLLMQFQADILDVPVVRPQIIETTAFGAAFLAGLAVGFWDGVEEIERIWLADRTFEPKMSEAERERRKGRWRQALDRARGWDRPS